MTKISFDEAWAELEAVRPEGWIVELYDSGEHGPYNPSPDSPFGMPRYWAKSKLGILSSPPKIHGTSDESLAEAVHELALRLAERA